MFQLSSYLTCVRVVCRGGVGWEGRGGGREAQVP